MASNERLKQELENFTKRMIKLIDDEGVECPGCGEQFLELPVSGLCPTCSAKRDFNIKNKQVDAVAVEREKERADIFG